MDQFTVGLNPFFSFENVDEQKYIQKLHNISLDLI